MPRHDNTFGGGNYDADDLDEWMTLQRDWQVDAGIEPAGEDEVLAVRERAARAIQAVFDELGFPPVSDEEIAAATLGHSSHDLPDRDRGEDVIAADRVLAERITAAAIALALDRRGFGEIAERVVGMQRQRVSADYLQTSSVIDAEGAVHSAVNDPNDYRGPGTGYVLEGERWALLQALPHEVDPASVGLTEAADGPALLRDLGASLRGAVPDEVVVAVGPAFGDSLRETIGGIPHGEVLRQICAGIEEEGVRYRVVRIGRTSDVAFIAHDGAQLAGSGIAVGLQSKGTAVIHRADLQPLDNLELFGMAPLLRPESYRQIGRNAARYANGGRASPVPLVLDNFARAKLIVRTTLLHRRETEAIMPGAAAVDVTLA
jgi:hypothetical protein